MIQFKENTQTDDGRMDRRTDGRMDRRMDRRTDRLYKTLPTTTVGPIMMTTPIFENLT